MTPALYLLTPSGIGPDFADPLAAALDAGLGTPAEVACVQLRMKDASDDAVLRTAEALLPVCAARGVGLFVNDRADLAKKAGADGVHLGQSDGSVGEARRLLGEDAEIGVTCHDSYHLAMQAGEAGADYVAFGAFYPSGTKDAAYKAEPELLTTWQAMTVLPCVAIGGITPQTAPLLLRAGADFLAVCGAVWNHAGGPEAAMAAFARALQPQGDAL